MTTLLGILKLPTATSYTLFELNITDWDSLVSPDSVVVAFFSSNPDSGLEGGILIVDDIELDFGTAIETINISTDQFHVYPNPASGFLTVSFDKKNNFTQLNIFSSLGTLISSVNISEENSIQLKTADYPSGLYWIEMKNKNGELVREKFLKTN